jgi:TatA/E family protein of Tat protein translocase
MGNLGMPEILMILVIALIIFGPRKLPEIGKTLGQSLAHFRKASEDFKRQWEDEVEIEKRKIDAAPVRDTTPYDAGVPAEYYSPSEHGAVASAGEPQIHAPVPTVEPAAATVPRIEGGAKETKRDWM